MDKEVDDGAVQRATTLNIVDGWSLLLGCTREFETVMISLLTSCEIAVLLP